MPDRNWLVIALGLVMVVITMVVALCSLVPNGAEAPVDKGVAG
jgi:hypothetical protein